MTNRCFDINLSRASGWTEGESWADCNPAQLLRSIYAREYTTDEDAGFRLENGDNFYIGSLPDAVQDWRLKRPAWLLDIDAVYGGEVSFYFGVAVGSRDIDVTLDKPAPYVIGDGTQTLIELDAAYHRFYGLRIRDFDAAIRLLSDNDGITIDGAVTINTTLLDANGFTLTNATLRNWHVLESVTPVLALNDNASGVSLQRFNARGRGNIGVSVGSGHSDIEIISGKIVNDDHGFSESDTLYTALFMAAGSTAIVRYQEYHGFSGPAYVFHCPVKARALHSYFCGAGIYVGGAGSVFYDCFQAWTRQLAGDSYAYYCAADCEFINCGTNLDETGGLGVFVATEGVTVTITGGDYRACLPLPFVTALGNCTVNLDNVRINGNVFTETLNLTPGQSWRETLAAVTTDVLPVYANQVLHMPYNHIPDLWDAVSVQGSDRPFENVIDLPSGAKIAPMKQGSVKYLPGDAWLHLDAGETAIDYFRYSTETEIYTHQFEIHPPANLGPRVVAPDGFSGANWTQNGQVYSATAQNDVLSASYAFEADEVYQIQIQLTDITAGSIKPRIGGVLSDDDYSHTIPGFEVWLIRAPVSASVIDIVPTGFTGTIGAIYVKKLLCSGAVPTPTVSATDNGDGTIEVKWDVVQAARIRDTVTADVTVTGLMYNDPHAGFIDYSSAGKNFRFDNVEANAVRKGISLYGCDSVEVNGFKYTGGYTGQSQIWQNAIVIDQNDGPFAMLAQIHGLDADLLLDSSYGNYSSEFGNSDIIVINGGYQSTQPIYEKTNYVTNLDGKHGSDSIIDTKAYTEVNYASMLGSYRNLRVHNVGTVRLSNSQLTQEYGTREALTVTHSHAIIELWNTAVDGIRCVTLAQMGEQKKDDSFYYEGASVTAGDRSIHVLKSYPSHHDYGRCNMTDMEFEYSSNGGSSWSNLPLDNVGLPGVQGSFKRTVSLSAGSYQLRARCRNGGDIGAWSSSLSITVS